MGFSVDDAVAEITERIRFAFTATDVPDQMALLDRIEAEVGELRSIVGREMFRSM